MPAFKNIKKFLKGHWFLLLLAFTFLLKIPALFEPFTYGDEGIYLTLGQAVRKGLVLYRDIHDNKPPLIYLMAALTNSFFYYRLLFLAWSFATIGVFYNFVKLIFPKNRTWSIALPTIVFAVLTSLPILEGNIANAENFMILPTIGAFFLVFKFLDQNKIKSKISLKWFLAGLLMSLAFLFKVPGLFDFAALIALLVILISKKNFKASIWYAFLGILGFLLPILITVAYFAYHQALKEYLISAFSQNLPYLASWSAGTMAADNGLPTALIIRAFIVLVVFIILWIFKKKIPQTASMIVLWFFFTLFAALLSSRPYPHYLLQVIPPLSLSLGFLGLPKTKISLKMIFILLSVTLIGAAFSFRFWHYPNWPYYRNFYKYIFRAQSQSEYFAYFGNHTQDIYDLSSFIKSHTQDQDEIFIWGTQPSIYSLAERLPIGRYTVSYHIIDFNGYQQTLETLNQKQPTWIIKTADEKRPFAELDTFLDYNYALFQTINGHQIYYHIPKFVRL